jgi:hypothetical protein
MTAETKPVIELQDIPRYFGGGLLGEGDGTDADYRFASALDALVALTGRGEDDPAVKLITGLIDDAHADLLSMACNYGRCIPDGTGDGLDEWDDDVLFEVTGHRRKPVHPDTHTPRNADTAGDKRVAALGFGRGSLRVSTAPGTPSPTLNP